MTSEHLMSEIDNAAADANDKHGHDRDLPYSEWACILMEEVGEVAAAINDCDGYPRGSDAIRAELLQVAGTAANFIDALDRQGRTHKDQDHRPPVRGVDVELLYLPIFEGVKITAEMLRQYQRWPVMTSQLPRRLRTHATNQITDYEVLHAAPRRPSTILISPAKLDFLRTYRDPDRDDIDWVLQQVNALVEATPALLHPPAPEHDMRGYSIESIWIDEFASLTPEYRELEATKESQP